MKRPPDATAASALQAFTTKLQSQVAATAAASGIAEPVAMVIGGAVVVMNADQVATALEAGYQVAKLGMSAAGRETIMESVGMMKQGLRNSLNETNTAARQRLKEFDIQ